MKSLFPPQSRSQIILLRLEFFSAFSCINDVEPFPGIDLDRTLFHDCRGKIFEMLLCQFSIKVVIRYSVLMTQAEEAAKASTSSRSEQRSLLPLSTAHHASLTDVLKKKQSQQSLRDAYAQSNYYLALKKIHLQNQRRVNEIPNKIDARAADQLAREFSELDDQFYNMDWEGGLIWKEILLSNKIEIPDEIMNHPVPKGDIPVLGSSSDEAPTSDPPNRSGALDETAKAQQVQPEPNLLEDLDKRVKAQEAKIESLSSFLKLFNSDQLDPRVLSGSSPRPGSVTEKVEEYEKLIEMINTNIPGVYQPRISDTGTHVHDNRKRQSSADSATKSSDSSETDVKAANYRPPEEKFTPVEDTSDLLPQETARSTMSGPSSQPKLPTPLKHQPSLVERTRESMALAKAEEKAESGIARSEDVPSSPIHIPDSLPSGSDLKLTGSATLVERTRKSMSLLPVKSRAPRTPLSKKPSKTYPINAFETPKASHAEMPGISSPPEESFGENAKYASVFKSRPKIALSPTRAPSLGCMDEVFESENDLFVSQGTASSPPANATRSTERS